MWLFELFFLSSANLICRGTDISKYFRGPLEFELTRVDCTIKLAYRKLTNRDISFLKIKAHEVGAVSSWAFFDKVPLNKILKVVVWNQSSKFAKFYLRDRSEQTANLQNLRPIIAAQKWLGDWNIIYI